MVVCICGCVNEQDIREAIEHGHTTLESLQDELGVCRVCESCHGAISYMLEEAKLPLPINIILE
jgi:bacterioferritin-associated ferredoxin